MPETRRSSMALVGDGMFLRRLDSFPGERGAGFQRVLARLRESAVGVGNLEMPLSRRGSRQPKYANLRSDPERATEVRALGFQGVTLANNHMMDYGAEADRVFGLPSRLSASFATPLERRGDEMFFE